MNQRPATRRSRARSLCQFVEDYETGSIACTSPSSSRRYFIVEDVNDDSKEFYVPLDRFWSQDQSDLRSEAFARNMLVMVDLDEGSQEFVGSNDAGRNRAAKVVKAVLCYPDTGKPKNSYVDVR